MRQERGRPPPPCPWSVREAVATSETCTASRHEPRLCAHRAGGKSRGRGGVTTTLRLYGADLHYCSLARLRGWPPTGASPWGGGDGDGGDGRGALSEERQERPPAPSAAWRCVALDVSLNRIGKV